MAEFLEREGEEAVEMTELAYVRNEENFMEEIADVLNVIQGIVYHKDWEARILESQDQKLDRQLKRIYDEKRKVTEKKQED
jgi:phosphoribosyl-ATP pyrophosphohydrolase